MLVSYVCFQRLCCCCCCSCFLLVLLLLPSLARGRCRLRTVSRAVAQPCEVWSAKTGPQQTLPRCRDRFFSASRNGPVLRARGCPGQAAALLAIRRLTARAALLPCRQSLLLLSAVRAARRATFTGALRALFNASAARAVTAIPFNTGSSTASDFPPSGWALAARAGCRQRCRACSLPSPRFCARTRGPRVPP